MKLTLVINKKKVIREIDPGMTLLEFLRAEGYFGAKFGGCAKGECGACTVLLDAHSVNSCSILAAQAEGHLIETIEGIGEHPEQGWKKTDGFSDLQKSFIESGAIQCGYCTPAMILNAKALFESKNNPDETDIRGCIIGSSLPLHGL